MEMTIKQLAIQLGVSKTTISKAISELGLQGKLKRSGNKYLLSDMQIESVKTQIENHKTQTVRPKTQTKNYKLNTKVCVFKTKGCNLKTRRH